MNSVSVRATESHALQTCVYGVEDILTNGSTTGEDSVRLACLVTNCKDAEQFGYKRAQGDLTNYSQIMTIRHKSYSVSLHFN